MDRLAVARLPEEEAPATVPDPQRLRALFDQHFDFTWRAVRRLGLPPHLADDVTQRVFVVASQRLDDIRPGSERAFLFQTAVRVACSERRTIARRREVLAEEPAGAEADDAPGPDELVDRRRAREVLDRVLSSLDLDLRVVLILFELERLTLDEIAETLSIPRGTAASRLRRARQQFTSALERYKAQNRRGAR